MSEKVVWDMEDFFVMWGKVYTRRGKARRGEVGVQDQNTAGAATTNAVQE
jgi:hypothetical protein